MAKRKNSPAVFVFWLKSALNSPKASDITNISNWIQYDIGSETQMAGEFFHIEILKRNY